MDEPERSDWLEAFHRGDRAALEECYRRHFATVTHAVGTRLDGADRETIVHEVFARLLTSPELRRSFHGGSFGAWVGVVARNQAIDYARRRGRELQLPEGDSVDASAPWQDAAEARVLVERFRRERLRPDWAGVFEQRFLLQLTQEEASRALGIGRTTLAYRELRIRRDLRAFLLEEDPS